MKTLSNKKIYFILVFIAIFLPSSVLASTVYISTNHSEFFVGDSIVFSVRIDSEGKDINAVEGEVLLDHAVDAVFLTNINNSDSAFSIWPKKPLPSERNERISFIGGVPSGLVAKDATIFSVVFKLEKTGQIALSPKNIEVYLNDGKGTKDEVSIKNMIVDVLPKKSDAQSVDDWNNLISNDKTAPEPFEIYLGQEDSVFDGKKFLSFNTTDKQSGISYYEVLESNLPPVRSNDTYILQEQDKPVKVTVNAYDSAGNVRESVYNPKHSYLNLVIIGIPVLLLLVTLVFIVAKKRKKKKEKKKKKK
ncbi:MAG: hypothetical protein ACI8V7_000367 [Candidatus Paceibacteria bacterium]|jgi:hypothetical protein